MKKTMLVATFLAVGAGSAGVSALDTVTPMLGSDTLKDFTLAVLTPGVCPGITAFTAGPPASGLDYQGGGSGGGETKLILSSTLATPTQTVAPMSRFLAAPATCGAAGPAHAEAINFATDGLGVVVSKQHQVACDPNNATPTAGAGECTAHGPTGLKSSGTLDCTGDPASASCVGNVYTLGAGSTAVPGWRDALRLIYLGLPGTAGKDPDGTTPAGQALRSCSSQARKSLVNTWGNVFENACDGAGCTQLSHVWRRDLLSGTTDVFRELINAKLYPFCNSRFTTDAKDTALTTVPYPTVLVGGANDGKALFEDPYQDFDPIRRTCVGGANGQGGSLPAPTNGGTTQPDFPAAVADQVCGPRGDLGLVLVVRQPVFTGADASQVFPTQPCLRGKLALGPAPKVPGTSKSTLCPNGDVTLGNSASQYDKTTGIIASSSNICLVPAGADGSPQCINGKNNFPAPIDPPFTAIPSAQRDGRVYNLHLYTAGATYRADTELGVARSVVGAFTRIHATRTLLASGPTCPGTAGSGRCCDKTDSTDQIGCLAEADACSIGFAGGVALDSQLQTSAALETNFGASINNVLNAKDCIQAASYPLSRKVYLSSVIGFKQVTGQELSLAKCFSGNITGGITAFNSLLAAKNLFPVLGGTPVCQDFDETSCTGSNVNACVQDAIAGVAP